MNLASLLEYLIIHSKNYMSSDRKGESMAKSLGFHIVSHNSSLSFTYTFQTFLVDNGIKKSLKQRKGAKTRTSTEECWGKKLFPDKSLKGRHEYYNRKIHTEK